jgi:NAD(P)-dependent dehydrogenase (short-subunit alcohol dehydrogenase family)
MDTIPRRALATAAFMAGAYTAARATMCWLRKYDFRNRLVVITGGSRGLGLVLARHLARQDAALIICARDDNELANAEEELRNIGPYVAAYGCDLTQPEEITQLFNRIRREIGAVDVLINNAGVIQVGPLETMTMAEFDEAMATHFWAPFLCAQQVIPEMRRRRQGRIVNISSIGGKIAIPHLAPYCASKFALVGLSKSMRAELIQDGIYVTTVCPGLMRTGSARHGQFKGNHRAEYAWFSISGALPLVSMNADRAARLILSACKYGRAEVTLSLPARLATTIDALAPGLTADLTAMAAGLLPAPNGAGREAVAGCDSTSAWSPSVLTTLNERAAAENNELSPKCGLSEGQSQPPPYVDAKDIVDETSEESFPASDPPSWTPVTSTS